MVDKPGTFLWDQVPKLGSSGNVDGKNLMISSLKAVILLSRIYISYSLQSLTMIMEHLFTSNAQNYLTSISIFYKDTRLNSNGHQLVGNCKY